jgi:hypothetical protein
MGSVPQEERCNKPVHVENYPDVPCRLRAGHEGDHKPLTAAQTDALARGEEAPEEED